MVGTSRPIKPINITMGGEPPASNFKHSMLSFSKRRFSAL